MRLSRALCRAGRVGLLAAGLWGCAGCAEFWRTRFPPQPERGPGMPPARPSPAPQPPAPDPPQPPPQPPPERPAYPTALAVPGRAGHVFSPYNNKLVDVTGFASGTLVADPQYPAAERKYFRVP